MQLIQQLLAAMLNMQAFGTSDGGVIAAAKAVYCDAAHSTKNAILAQKDALEAFNQSGDSLPFPPGVNPGPADPQGAKAAAIKPFWDVLP